MDMNAGYWVVEYGKVACGYLFLMFLWPSVVFYKYLRGKSKTWRFGFCVTAPIIIMNTAVLMLGLFHVLNQWIICLLFYGTFVLAFVKNILAYLDGKYRRMMETEFPDVRTLKGRYRILVLVLLFFIVCYRYVKKAARFLSFDYMKKIRESNWPRVRVWIKKHIWNFWRRFSAQFWRYGVLAIVILYGMVYFNYGAFQVFSYGAGDLYTHHGWIYALMQGRIFAEGVYPEAMHCFVYCMHSVLGIKVHSILLYLQGIHVAVFLISVYLLLRKIFHWRYTPHFVLMMFLTLDLSNADLINSMFRLQVTLPQEFGLHTVCLCALFLVEYLNREYTCDAGKKRKILRFLRDENLLLFMTSMAAAVMIHFHIVLMAILVCAAFSIGLLKKAFDKRSFFPLLCSLFCAGVIAVLPMAGALAQGIPFNVSIDWAIYAMSGDESRELRTHDERDDQNTVENDDEQDQQNIQRNEISITGMVIRCMSEIYKKGYATLYGEVRGIWMMVLTAVIIVFWLLVRGNEKLLYLRKVCGGYLPAIIASVFYVVVYAAPMIGWPDIIPEGRFFAPGHMMLLSVMLMPVDIVFSCLQHFCNDIVLRGLSLLSIGGIYGIAVITGNFRGMLFYQLSRYNAAAAVTESIIDTFPRFSYTIVSPTDELYPVIQYGWHEELLRFVENLSSDTYSIPSEYVFIFVEKEPLFYAQCHFFQGPWWMAEEKYLEPFWKVYAYKYPESGASQSPEILKAQISEEEALEELPEYENAWHMYLKPENRKILEAKTYEWCQWFAKENPSVLNVYYEDESFVCYYFRQNPGSTLYELGTGR